MSVNILITNLYHPLCTIRHVTGWDNIADSVHETGCIANINSYKS
jgi:hypothetical protein